MATTSPLQAVPENLSLPDVEAAHVQLMKLYQAALRHADGLHRFVKRIDVEVPSDAILSGRLRRRAHRAAVRPATLRFLVRSFVNGHIANRLKELRNQYEWSLQALPREDPARACFAERQQELDGLSGDLPSRSRVLAAVGLLAGPVTAALLIFLGGDDLWYATLSQLGALAFTAFVMIAVSFAYKRALFLGGPDHPTTKETRAGSAENIYAAEDSLWSGLGARKKPEPKLDRWPTYVSFPLALLEGIAAVVSDEGRGLYILGTVLFLAGGLGGLWYGRGRRYR